jgi:hypothetical protein
MPEARDSLSSSQERASVYPVLRQRSPDTIFISSICPWLISDWYNSSRFSLSPWNCVCISYLARSSSQHQLSYLYYSSFSPRQVSKWYNYPRLSHGYCVRSSHFTRTSRWCHSSLFDNPNNIWWAVNSRSSALCDILFRCIVSQCFLVTAGCEVCVCVSWTPRRRRVAKVMTSIFIGDRLLNLFANRLVSAREHRRHWSNETWISAVHTRGLRSEQVTSARQCGRFLSRFHVTRP